MHNYRERRNALKLSQQDLATICDVSQQAISKIETGNYKTSTVAKIVNAKLAVLEAGNSNTPHRGGVQR